MADSFIQLSPDSTGKKVDTRTAPDGDHREVQVIGSPTTADVAEADTANGLDVDVTRLPALPAGTNNIGDVDIVSLPNEGQQTMAGSISVAIASDQSAVPVSGTVAVTGSATLAEQQAQTALLTTIDADTGGILTSVQTLDNAIAGSEMQVDIVAPLPAGTNNIGDVDILSSALPTGASTLVEQQTQTAHLSTIAGDTTDIETAVELIDDTVKTLGTDTYTEATTKGLLVGAIRRDADTTLVDTTNEVAPLQVDANGRLKVEAFSGETLPVSGTVTANAGTNLNTSALALEAGGNLAGAATSLAIMDDWDETDRAKVNPIAGQAGVQGASGAVTALTQRVVLATDVALPAGTNNIGDVDVLTVPAPLSTSGGGTEATALRVTLASDSTGLVSVDDNGGSLTVDGTVTANPTAKTILSTGGSASGSGNNTLIAAGTNRLKVFAFSLTTLSTTAMTCIFQSGAGGTELWRVVLQAPTSVSTGANLSVAPPAWLFATASATLLNLNLSSANAVNWSVAYYDEV